MTVISRADGHGRHSLTTTHRHGGRSDVRPIPRPREAADDHVVVLDGTMSHPLALLAKDVLDRGAALIGLLCVLPMLIVIGIAICLTSPGPALFRQERVGLDGITFRVWKFRTMRREADTDLHTLLKQHGRDQSPLFKVPDDPRITRLGHVLRRTSIDELPQLLNVVCGQMSLVGPRPQRPAEVELYAPHERLRLRVKPGMTGLWQVSGRSSLTWTEAVEFDLRYVREWSLLLDAKILLRTLPAVLGRRGAE